MAKARQYETPYKVIVGLVIIAIVTRLAARYQRMWYMPLYLTSHILYPLLYVYWGIWSFQRIVQTRLQKIIVHFDLLILLWLISRSVKYIFDLPEPLGRMIWYMYYFPLLFLPVLLLFISCFLGQPEEYRLPIRVKLLMIPSALMFALVMTNDYHQLIFRFETVPIQNALYHYGPLYAMFTLWELIIYTATFIEMQIKCRRGLKYSQVMIIVTPLLVMLAYHLAYLLGIAPVLAVFWDVTNVVCFCLVSYLEICMIYGVIPTNRYYLELADVTSVNIQLLDKDYKPLLHSSFAVPDQETIQEMEQTTIVKPDGIRLCAHELKKGWVLWQEDVSDLWSVQRQLSDVNEVLQGRQQVFQKEIETKKKISSVAEKNRLYDLLMSQLEPDIKAYRLLSEQDTSTMSLEERRLLLGKMSLICSYIKRSCNLIIINQMDGCVKSQELSYCFRESMENLKYLGIRGNYHFSLTKDISYEQFHDAYAAFHHLLLANIEGLSAFFVSLYQKDLRTILTLRISRNLPVDDYGLDHLTIETDEEESLITYTLKEKL